MSNPRKGYSIISKIIRQTQAIWWVQEEQR